MQNRGKVTDHMGRNLPSHKNTKILGAGAAKRNVSSKSINRKYITVSKGQKIRSLQVNSRKLQASERRCYERITYVVRRNASSSQRNKYSVVIKEDTWKKRYLQSQKEIDEHVTVVKEKDKKKQKNRGFVKDAALSAAKGEIEAQEGGVELLDTTETLKSVTQGTISLTKTTVQTGKAVFQSGKETVVFIKNKITNQTDQQETSKGQKLSAGRRNVSRQLQPVRRRDGVRSREAYKKRKNINQFRKKSDRGNTKIKNKVSRRQDSTGNVGKDIVKGTEMSKSSKLPVSKREVSRQSQPPRKMAGVRSREEYTERKNTHQSRKQPDKRNTKREERKNRDKQRKESIARKRMLTYIQNKTSQNPEKQDSIGNVAKDIVKGKAKQFGKNVASAFGKKILFYLASAFGGLFVIMMPIIVIVAFFYSSPLAIFFPGDDNSETIQDVLAGYYTEFCDQVEKEKETDGYDRITLKSATGEVDIEVSKSNYKDVLCVFAEKYGYDLQIADVSKEVKESLKKVFDDMNSYSINVTTSTTTNKKGEQIQKKIKTITITQKNWKDMVKEYDFDKESKKELKELLAYADELGIEGGEDEDYSIYAGTDSCIDGMVYDNPQAPIYHGSCAKIAKKTKNYIRPILKTKGMEPYIDIIVSMVQQESTFGKGDNANWMQVNGYDGEAGMASVKAGIDHFEGLIKKCETKKITDIKVLVQSYNFGTGYIDFVKENGGKDTLFLQESFQYKKSPDGHYGTKGYSLSVMSRVKGQEPKITVMPLYYQWDSRWSLVPYGTSTIGKGGCGICSSAMVVSYWTGKAVTPPELVEWAYIYHTPQGSSHALYAAVAKHYNLRYKDLGLSKESMVDELKKGHTVIASMGPGEFTGNSHLIVLRTIEKGKIRVNDPNDNSNKNHANKKYTPDAIHNEAQHYWSIYK